ncbi:MAG: zinc ribbon domain-containing protein [Dehalococcoidaceae bacterium]|nr:zinc ribbon domain-containing protein [Dehalococcoidaceae bacterium]
MISHGFCATCSAKLDGDEQFCPSCGRQLTRASSEPVHTNHSNPSRAAAQLAEYRRFLQESAEVTPGLVELLFETASERYQSGHLTGDNFKDITRDLFFEDFSGNKWSMGIKSGSWYRRENRDWLPAVPPAKLIWRLSSSKTSNNPGSKFCNQCGAAVNPHQKFCTGCGRQRV